MLEAMAAELPMVMSDTRQNREWIDDEVNGFLVEPRNPAVVADRLIRLLKEGGLVESFRRISLERVRLNGDASVNVPRIKEMVLRFAQPHHGAASTFAAPN